MQNDGENGMFETFLLSIIAFVATNLDDMIINTFFFSLASGIREIKSIVLGKYLGTGILILISILSSQGLRWIPVEYIKYLGFIPIVLGMKELLHKSEEDDTPSSSDASILIWKVAIVTIANGADNLGVYIPLFTEFYWNQIFVFVIVFIVMIAVWCAVGYQASNVESYRNTITKYKRAFVPLVYILLGIYILN